VVFWSASGRNRPLGHDQVDELGKASRKRGGMNVMARKWLLWGAALGATALLFGGHAIGSSKPNVSKLSPRPIDVRVRRISSFSKSGSAGDQSDALIFRGGLVLSSGNASFGGLSGLEISPDGKRLLAVSDAGAWLKAGLTYDGRRLAGVRDVTFGPLLAKQSRPLIRKRDRDAESLRLYKGSLDNGIALVGFELNDRVGFYPIKNGRLGAPIHYLRPPVRLSKNRGFEAAAVIRGGRYKGSIIAFAERKLDPDGHHSGWLWPAKKTKPGSLKASVVGVHRKSRRLAVKDESGFNITDVTSAANGDLYLLERRFRWSEGVKMRIRRIAVRDIKPGTLLKTQTLLQADLNSEIDNMEGLAIHQNKHGRTILTVISDDNFNSFLQRTLLLQFELKPL
jgi:hypothetical protein